MMFFSISDSYGAHSSTQIGDSSIEEFLISLDEPATPDRMKNHSLDNPIQLRTPVNDAKSTDVTPGSQEQESDWTLTSTEKPFNEQEVISTLY